MYYIRWLFTCVLPYEQDKLNFVTLYDKFWYSIQFILNLKYINMKNTITIQKDHISSVLIIINTFSIRSLNSSFEILLSPFSSISSKMSSTSSLVGLSTPIYFAIWTNTCSNSPLSKKPLPSISTFLNASSINLFIFLGSLIRSSKFFLLVIFANESIFNKIL